MPKINSNNSLTCKICETNITKHESLCDINRVPSNVLRHRDLSFTVWRCPKCRSIHSADSIDLDYFYKDYPMASQKLDYGTLCAFRTRLKYLKSIGIKPGAKVIDFGCSGGLFVDFLIKNGYEAFGYDPYIRKYSDAAVLNNQYDAILSYDVIEHYEDPQEFANIMYSTVKKGGVVVIGTPDAAKISLVDIDKYALELHQPYHRHIFSEKSLINYFKKLDFQHIKTRNRFCFDTVYPFVNSQFIWKYIRCAGNYMDFVIDIPKAAIILKNPSLIFWGIIGYYFPHRGSMVVAFKRAG